MQLLHDDLHWLDIPQRITFKLCLLVFKCLHGFAPRYLAELRVPVADVMGRRNLRSATRCLLNFPRYNMTNYGRRIFSYAGPLAWNSLSKHLRQTTSIDLFKRSLKTFLFGQISRSAHWRHFCSVGYTSLLTCLLTYFTNEQLPTGAFRKHGWGEDLVERGDAIGVSVRGAKYCFFTVTSFVSCVVFV